MKNNTVNTTTKTVWKLRFAQTSLMAGLIGSVSHLAYSVGAYELSGEGWISWIIAICVELGMLGISLGMADQRRKLSDPKYKPTELDTKSTVTLKRAMMLFAAVNVFGNAYYSFAVILNKPRFLLKDVQNNPDKIDEVTWAAILFFSIIVPALIYVMAELQSIYALNLILERQEQDRLEQAQAAAKATTKPGPKPQAVPAAPKPQPTTNIKANTPPEAKKVAFEKATKENVRKPEEHPIPGEGQKIRRKRQVVEEIVPAEEIESEVGDTPVQATRQEVAEPAAPEPDPITGVETLDPLRHNRLKVPVKNS